MPAYSTLYNNLVDRIPILAKKFVDDQIKDESESPLTFEPDPERLAAFRLLVHAEIEEYIEKKAKEWLNQKEKEVLEGNYKVSSLLEFYAISMLLKSELLFDVPFDRDKFTEALQHIIKSARDLIDSNNGIKCDSFMKLSLLCGKAIDEIDSTTAILLRDYGKARGDVAHKSTTSIRTIQAPSVELKNAQEIVKALGSYFYS
jgi:hypothetical protein